MLLFEKVVSLKNVFIMVKNLGSLIGKSSLVALDASILSKKKNMNIRGGVYFWWSSRLEEICNILRLFNVLPDFPFTTSETMCDYYL